MSKRKTERRISSDNHPLWYKQLINLNAEKRQKAIDNAMDRIKRAKPEAYKFIEQFKCELVGITPNISYSMPDENEQDLRVTFIHDYSQTTLLFWCKQGGFGFFINAALDHNAEGMLGFIR